MTEPNPNVRALRNVAAHAASYAVATVVALALVVVIVKVMAGDPGGLGTARTFGFFALMGLMLALPCAPVDMLVRRKMKNSRVAHMVALAVSLGGFAAIMFATMADSFQTGLTGTVCFAVGGMIGGALRAALIETPQAAG